MAEATGAAGIPNTFFGLRENLVYKPKYAYDRWKNAPDDYGTRRDRCNGAKARNSNLKQEYRCGTDGEDAEACSLVYRSDKKLEAVEGNLNNVSKPEGTGEKFRNAFGRSNRRDYQALDQATKYSDEAEKVAQSRSKLSVSSSQSSAPKWGQQNFSFKQDWSPPSPVQRGRSYEESRSTVYGDESGDSDDEYY